MKYTTIGILLNLANSQDLSEEEVADLQSDLQEAIEKAGLVVQAWDWEEDGAEQSETTTGDPPGAAWSHSEPIEGEHKLRTVDDRVFDVWPLIWRDGSGLSWEVNDVAAGQLLTLDGSFDVEPTDDEIRRLTLKLICRVCDAPVFDIDGLLREHLSDNHHNSAYAFSSEQVRDCYRSGE